VDGLQAAGLAADDVNPASRDFEHFPNEINQQAISLRIHRGCGDAHAQAIPVKSRRPGGGSAGLDVQLQDQQVSRGVVAEPRPGGE
jgi:hypothetical protein